MAAAIGGAGVIDPATLAVFLIVVVGILGLLIGSFLNVVIWRVPQGMSIVSPPSACPHCGARIKPYDNIPVVSYLVLRGKCRNCKAPVSVRYPLVELGTGVAFALVTWGATGGLWPLETLPVLLYLAAITVALGLIDLDTHRLPNTIVLPSYVVCALFLVLASVLTGDYAALLGALIGAVALFLLYFLLRVAYPAGMGGGDVKLAGVLGMVLGWFGWPELIVGGFGAFLIGGLIGAVLLIGRRATRKSGIPFGPSMLAGAWVGLAAGPAVAGWYLTLVGLS